MSVTVGHRTVTIGGQYKSVTQESMADGMSIKVDGHEITLTGDQLTIDGKTQVLEPDQNVEIWVDDKGQVYGQGGACRRGRVGHRCPMMGRPA